MPPGAVAATLDGRVLPLVRPNPQRILVFGDTGCRLDRNTQQDCNDPAAWPFAKIAAAAAKARPDLVVHVGDYHYRELPCPAERSGCAHSPWGYGFDAWYADFFDPAAPLFAAAPWIMVRGNHEDCARAGEGWIRFLDWLPASTICRDLTGIFVARLGDFGIVVVDGARAEDPKDDIGALAWQRAAWLLGRLGDLRDRAGERSSDRLGALYTNLYALRLAARRTLRDLSDGQPVDLDK